MALTFFLCRAPLFNSYRCILGVDEDVEFRSLFFTSRHLHDDHCLLQPSLSSGRWTPCDMERRMQWNGSKGAIFLTRTLLFFFLLNRSFGDFALKQPNIYQKLILWTTFVQWDAAAAAAFCSGSSDHRNNKCFTMEIHFSCFASFGTQVWKDNLASFPIWICATFRWQVQTLLCTSLRQCPTIFGSYLSSSCSVAQIQHICDETSLHNATEREENWTLAAFIVALLANSFEWNTHVINLHTPQLKQERCSAPRKQVTAGGTETTPAYAKQLCKQMLGFP